MNWLKIATIIFSLFTLRAGAATQDPQRQYLCRFYEYQSAMDILDERPIGNVELNYPRFSGTGRAFLVQPEQRSRPRRVISNPLIVRTRQVQPWNWYTREPEVSLLLEWDNRGDLNLTLRRSAFETRAVLRDRDFIVSLADRVLICLRDPKVISPNALVIGWSTPVNQGETPQLTTCNMPADDLSFDSPMKCPTN